MPSFRNVVPPSGRDLRVLDSYNQYTSGIEGRDHIDASSSSSSGPSSPLLVGHGANAQAGSSTDVREIFLPPPTTPSPRAKKHHGRRQELGYVPRPMNAFFVFRSKFNKDNRGSGKGQQNEMSKMAATAWKALTAAEKRPYEKESDRQKAEHNKAHPDYQYSPKRSRGELKAKAAKASVARALRKASVASTSAATSRSASESVRSTRATPQVSPVASSSSSTVAYSPKTLFPHAAPAPRHAAQNVVQCYEWMASLSSPRTSSTSPASSMASYPSSPYPSSPRILPYSRFPRLFQHTVSPRDIIPVVPLDPAPQMLHVEEVSKDEPIFVPDSPPPPTRRYREEPQYGYNAYNAYLPPRLASTIPSVVPFSTTMSAVPSSDMFCQWGMPSQGAAPDLDYLVYSMPGDLPASEHALMQMGYGGGYDEFLTTYAAADAAAEAQFDMSEYVDGWIDM